MPIIIFNCRNGKLEESHNDSCILLPECIGSRTCTRVYSGSRKENGML